MKKIRNILFFYITISLMICFVANSSNLNDNQELDIESYYEEYKNDYYNEELTNENNEEDILDYSSEYSSLSGITGLFGKITGTLCLEIPDSLYELDVDFSKQSLINALKRSNLKLVRLDKNSKAVEYNKVKKRFEINTSRMGVDNKIYYIHETSDDPNVSTYTQFVYVIDYFIDGTGVGTKKKEHISSDALNIEINNIDKPSSKYYYRNHDFKCDTVYESTVDNGKMVNLFRREKNGEIISGNLPQDNPSNTKPPQIIFNTFRLGGNNRYETAIEIAKKYSKGSKFNSIFIANALDFPDALTGSALAKKYNAPILLTTSIHTNNSKTVQYIKENLSKMGSIYLLGGVGAVPNELINELKNLGFTNFQRLGGSNRYETNIKIVEKMNVKKGTPIFVGNALGFADSLSASPISAIKQMPIFLTSKDSIPPQIIQAIKNIAPSKIYILGGEGAVSTKVGKELTKLGSVQRLGGQNRFETNININKQFNLNSINVTISNGMNFPDALAGSVLSADLNAPMILVNNNASNNIQKSYLDNSKMRNLFIFGSSGAVFDSVINELTR